jgi:hypothetical protein
METIHKKVQREREGEFNALVCCPWQRSEENFVTGSLICVS